MIWLVGEVNKHILHDTDGTWIGTFCTPQIAADIARQHNNSSKYLNEESVEIDNRLATSIGWTNRL